MEKPFFLLVEGSQVDWGGHDNDLEYVTNEYIEFDRAIGVALKFVDEVVDFIDEVISNHEDVDALEAISVKVNEFMVNRPLFNA